MGKIISVVLAALLAVITINSDYSKELLLETGLSRGEEMAQPSFGFIDAHADTITKAMGEGKSLFRNDLHLDFERLSQLGTPVQVFAIWLSDEYLGNAFEYTNSAIDFFESELEKHSDIIRLALNLEDMERNARNGIASAVLALEGGEPLVGRIENVDHFYNRGVRLITLTWSRENELGYGVFSGSDAGLKPFGIEVVKRMNELGIIIDVSHLNEAGFWDVNRLSAQPYVASHSNAIAVTNHNRNLKDDQIRAIVEKGGIIGINLFPGFLSRSGVAKMDDVMRHISHFIDLGAGNHLGLGCDFDGIPSAPEGLGDVSALNGLAKQIADKFDDETSFRIMSGNFHEFLKRFYAEG